MTKQLVLSLLILAACPFSSFAMEYDDSKASAYKRSDSPYAHTQDSMASQEPSPQLNQPNFEAPLDPDGKIKAGEDGLPLIH